MVCFEKTHVSQEIMVTLDHISLQVSGGSAFSLEP